MTTPDDWPSLINVAAAVREQYPPLHVLLTERPGSPTDRAAREHYAAENRAAADRARAARARTDNAAAQARAALRAERERNLATAWSRRPERNEA